MLQNYVASRLGYENTKSREELISVTERLHKLNKSILEPNKVPMQIEAWTLQGVMTPHNNSVWTHRGRFNAIKMVFAK